MSDGVADQARTPVASCDWWWKVGRFEHVCDEGCRQQNLTELADQARTPRTIPAAHLWDITADGYVAFRDLLAEHDAGVVAAATRKALEDAAREIENEIPESGPHINMTARRQGLIDAYRSSQRMLRAHASAVGAATRNVFQDLADEIRAENETHAATYPADQRFRDGLSHCWAKLLRLGAVGAATPASPAEHADLPKADWLRTNETAEQMCPAEYRNADGMDVICIRPIGHFDASPMGPITDEPDIPPTPSDARRSSIEGGPLATIRYDTAPWGDETERRVGEPIDVPRGCGWCKRPASIWRYSASGDVWPSCGDHGLMEPLPSGPAVGLDVTPDPPGGHVHTPKPGTVGVDGGLLCTGCDKWYSMQSIYDEAVGVVSSGDPGECPDCGSQDQAVIGEYPMPSPVTGNPIDKTCDNDWHETDPQPAPDYGNVDSGEGEQIDWPTT